MMRRAAWLLWVAVTLGLALRWRCLGKHDAERDPATGGYRCRRRWCPKVGADLDEMGLLDGAYLRPVRTTYARENGAITRSAQ